MLAMYPSQLDSKITSKSFSPFGALQFQITFSLSPKSPLRIILPVRLLQSSKSHPILTQVLKSPLILFQRSIFKPLSLYYTFEPLLGLISALKSLQICSRIIYKKYIAHYVVFITPDLFQALKPSQVHYRVTSKTCVIL